MSPSAAPCHPHRVIEKALGVFQPSTSEELDDVTVGVGEAKDLAARGDPPAARTEQRMHNYRSTRHTSRVRRALHSSILSGQSNARRCLPACY